MWTILYGLVQNAALLSLVLLAYVALPGDLGWGDRRRDRAVLGLVLAVASVLAMFSSVEVSPGVIFDVRAAPVIVAGMLGGWVAAFCALLPALGLRVWLGGSGMAIGLLALMIYAVGGVLLGAISGPGRSRPGPWIGGVGTIVISLFALTSLFFLPDRTLGMRLFQQMGPVVILGNLVGVGLIASILVMERRRRDLLDSLRASEAAARTALEARTRFTANMSHEIRTPLNSVIGYAQLLADERLPDLARQRLRRLSAAAISLLGLLDDVLDYAKIQAGQLAVAPRPTDVGARLQTCIDVLEQLSAERQVAVRLHVAADLPASLLIDGDRLAQIGSNLVSNALKFTEAGHVEVALSYGAPAGMLELRVTDTGVGIAEGDLDRIFQPFERTKVTAAPGTGLGLTVVATVVRSMGGSIDVASRPGEGSTFTVRLPCVPSQDGSAAGRVEGAPDAQGAQDVALDGLAVLIVDDTEMNADILRAMLVRAGCIVSLAANGREAVDAVADRRLDLVLMDVRMPVMDGYEATRTIRAMEQARGLPRVPVVALTAHVSRADHKACRDAGMDAFLTKPVDRNVLLRTIGRFCRGQGNAVPAPSMPAAFGPAGEADAGSGRPRPPARGPAWPAGDPSLPLLDRARLQQIAHYMDDDQVAALLDSAIAAIEADAAGLARDPGFQGAAADVELPARVAPVFHRLISIAGNTGLTRLSMLCRELEARAMREQLDGRAELDAFLALASDSLAALRDYDPRAAAARPSD